LGDGTRGERRILVTTAIAVLALVVSACGGEPEPPSAEPSATLPAAGDPGADKLAQILDRGTLVGFFEPDYPPQSFAVEGAQRPADTKCREDQLTAAEVTGFDVETTKIVAEALGVEACFVDLAWTQVTAGNWGDRLDIAYGSGSINLDRMERLWMTQPYYAVPNVFFVRDDAPYQTPGDLDGKKIGACASCSHELYLKGELVIPGVETVQSVNDPEIVTFETEGPGLQALADGGIDAFLTAAPVGQGQIDAGLALRPLEEVAFTEHPTGFVDKSSGLDVRAFVEKVNEIITEAHADGQLKALSMEYFGADYTAAAAAFDLDAIGQVVT
jgi:ABC-type amino acid transport substrate-binding protein